MASEETPIIGVSMDELVRRKLIDAEVPGAVIDFDPDEADRAGAFVEDALSEEDARAAEEGADPHAISMQAND